MPPQALSLALLLLEEAIKATPVIADELKTLLTKTDPTALDWVELRVRVAGRTYRDYVPATALPVPDAAAPGTSTAALDRTPGI